MRTITPLPSSEAHHVGCDRQEKPCKGQWIKQVMSFENKQIAAEPPDSYWSVAAPPGVRSSGHVTVIGAGVIGLASAAALVRTSRSVTVLDAGREAAAGATRGNGCQLSYGYVAPLAQPGLVSELPKLLFSRGAPLSMRPQLDPAQWRWLWDFMAACRAPVAARSTVALLELGALSRAETERWIRGADAHALSFSESGKLVVYSSAASFEAGRRQMALQAPFGPAQMAISAEECIAIEPALASLSERIQGAIHTPSECVVDSLALCRDLERRLRACGVVFDYDTQVTGFTRRGSRITHLSTRTGTRSVDQLVLANGTGSAALARKLGIRLPVYPLKGYSITAEITDDARAPRVSVTDAANKVVYARIGQRLRVAGMLEIRGHGEAVDSARIAQLAAHTRAAFGTALKLDSLSPWAGLRPATPSSLPIIGPAPLDNVFLNVGHGGLGLTLAFGSARRLADAMDMRGRNSADPIHNSGVDYAQPTP